MFYFGLIGWVCEDEACGTIGGPAAKLLWFLPRLSDDGTQFRYMIYNGSYWFALRGSIRYWIDNNLNRMQRRFSRWL